MLHVWGFVAYTFFKVKIAKAHTLEKLKASIRHEIDFILEIELMRLNAHFLKRCQKCVDEGGQHFQHLML